MSVAFYLVLALSFGVNTMLLFRRCGEQYPVRLSEGLLYTLMLAVLHAAFLYLGVLLGTYLCFYSPDDPTRYSDVNAYIFIGLAVVVMVKMIVPYLRRNPELPVFDLFSVKSVLAMAIASGINVLLIGIGTGFIEQHPTILKIAVPTLIISVLFGYLGLMFGRQKVQLRPRRWAIISAVLLAGAAVAALITI